MGLTGASPDARAQDPPVIRMNLVDPGPVGAASTTGLFAQVAVGGGYNTTFTISNTGSDTLAGDLFLTDDAGRPLSASISSAGSLQNPAVVATSSSINVPPGGVQIITANPATPGDPTLRAGAASIVSSGGSVSGVSTFRQSGAAGLITVVGVLASQPVTVATIPVDDNAPTNRFTGYAVINSSGQAINIKSVVVNSDGSIFQTLNPPQLNPLAAGAHFAGFLFQDLNNPNLQFKGSLVLISQNAQPFGVVALLLDGSLLTAIPVTPAKAPNIN